MKFCSRQHIFVCTHWGDKICPWFCCGYIKLYVILSVLVDSCDTFSHFFRVTSMALEQSYNCPSTSEITLKDKGKSACYKTQHNKIWIMFIILVCTVICHQAYQLTHWHLGDVAVILKVWFSNSLHRIIALALTAKLLPGEYHRTSLMISPHWFM